MAFISAGVVWVWIGLKKLISQQVWLIGLFCLAILDWGGVARLSFSPRHVETVLFEQNNVAEYLASQAGRFRVYSPSYSLPQQTAIAYDLNLVDGVDPMQLQTYAEYMEQASGVPREGYQVTIPTYASGNPPRDNIPFLPDLSALGKLNVAFLVAEYDINMEGLKLAGIVDGTRIYRNPELRPRAWVQPSDTPIGSEFLPAEINYWSPNRIEITAQGSGMLVLSEIAYPGWRVMVDGVDRPIISLENLFRGVKLDSGRHRIVFQFIPVSLIFGLIISFVGIVTWLILKFRSRYL
jgi:hypothetical protein